MSAASAAVLQLVSMSFSSLRVSLLALESTACREWGSKLLEMRRKAPTRTMSALPPSTSGGHGKGWERMGKDDKRKERKGKERKGTGFLFCVAAQVCVQVVAS